MLRWSDSREEKRLIKSMTGYGRARETLNKRDITVEVRSVNNRYLDCSVKMPRMYSFAEDGVKSCVQKAVSRGKVDVFITVDASAADVAKVNVNRELAASYAAALKELSEVFRISLPSLMQFSRMKPLQMMKTLKRKILM